MQPSLRGQGWPGRPPTKPLKKPKGPLVRLAGHRNHSAGLDRQEVRCGTPPPLFARAPWCRNSVGAQQGPPQPFLSRRATEARRPYSPPVHGLASPGGGRSRQSPCPGLAIVSPWPSQDSQFRVEEDSPGGSAPHSRPTRPAGGPWIPPPRP